MESAIDELARALGHDALDLRLRNCVVEGDPRPNGAAWPRIGLKQCLEALRDHPAWIDREHARAAGRGVGIAVGGWPGGIEPATAVCRLDANGKLTVVLGSVDLTGTNTTFAQVAAESFGLAPDDIQVTTASTDSAPFAGGTGGSKITTRSARRSRRRRTRRGDRLWRSRPSTLRRPWRTSRSWTGVVRVKGVPGSGLSLEQIAGMTMGFTARHERSTVPARRRSPRARRASPPTLRRWRWTT
jgi:CO/xanthine dehydrogenase Mo-binding subunit